MNLDLNRSTAFVLRAGIAAGIVLMAVGLALYCMNSSETMLYAGVLVLIASPFLGVIVTFAILVVDRDWTWAAVAAVLLAVTAVGIILSIE